MMKKVTTLCLAMLICTTTTNLHAQERARERRTKGCLALLLLAVARLSGAVFTTAVESSNGTCEMPYGVPSPVSQKEVLSPWAAAIKPGYHMDYLGKRYCVDSVQRHEGQEIVVSRSLDGSEIALHPATTFYGMVEHGWTATQRFFPWPDHNGLCSKK